jgi:hypothetical protein
MRHWIEFNRAPVLKLWAVVVAERLGFVWEEVRRAVAGLNAYLKGKALGMFEPLPEAVKEKRARREKGGALDRSPEPQGASRLYKSRHESPSEGSACNSGFGHELSRACFRGCARRGA